MEIITNTYTLEQISFSVEKYFSANTLFFDIECTGLSPRKSYIYLIGYAFRLDNEINLVQLLANNENEEIEILTEFEKVLSNFENLMGYNSTRFDESFIIERCKKYKIETSIKKKNHIDMYLTTTKAKCILDLPNYKQKTIELFLGLNREDKYNGGELIPIYKEYVTSQDQNLKDLLLLHNYEDIKGMVYITDILAYVDLLTSDITFVSNESANEETRFVLKSDISVPISINKIREYGLYIVNAGNIIVKLNTYNGELYTWLNDYKNYCYLLNEDIIVPKVLTSSMDKSYYRPAGKKDCKVSLNSTFIQVPEKIDFGKNYKFFKKDYDAEEFFIDINEIAPELIIKIFKYMLKH